MKIKTAYIIETVIRLIGLMLILPFYLIGKVLLYLAKPLDWIFWEEVRLANKIGHNLFLKSKMSKYVKNEGYKKMLTARTAYKLKKQLLTERPDLSENDL